MQLKTKDKRLLGELDFDGRKPLSQAASNIHISKEVASYRLKKLREEGVVTGFVADVNYSAQNQTRYVFRINLRDLQEEKEDIITFWNRHPHVDTTHYLQSSTDFEVQIWAENPADLNKTWNTYKNKYGDRTYLKDLSVVLREHYFGHEFIHNQQQETIQQIQEPIKIKPEKQKFLRILEKNSRKQLVDIAAELSVTATTCARWLRELKKEGIITTLRPRIDASKLGYTAYQVVLSLIRASETTKIIGRLRQSPNVIRSQEYLGVNNISFQCYFKETEELDEFLTDLRRHVHSIEDFTVRNCITFY